MGSRWPRNRGELQRRGTQMRGSAEHALRRDGWIVRDDLRREIPDLDDGEFLDLMRRMEGDGYAEFKLVDGTTWMRVTEQTLYWVKHIAEKKQ